MSVREESAVQVSDNLEMVAERVVRAFSRTCFSDDILADARATTATTVTVTYEDCVLLCDASGGAVTLNLPSAAAVPGKVLFIKKTEASANAVTITPNGSETIDGAASLAIGGGSTRASRIIISDGSNWHVWHVA